MSQSKEKLGFRKRSHVESYRHKDCGAFGATSKGGYISYIADLYHIPDLNNPIPIIIPLYRCGACGEHIGINGNYDQLVEKPGTRGGVSESAR